MYLNQQPLVRYYAGRDPRVTMISPLEITHRHFTERWSRGQKRDHNNVSV